jgi:hypothetical protein
LEAVEKIGLDEGLVLDSILRSESSRRHTNIASGSRVTSALSESRR